MSADGPSNNADDRPSIKGHPELYRLLVQSVRQYAIFALDPTGHIVSWNPGAQNLKGYRADEIIGKHFSIFYSEEDRKRGHPEEELEWAVRDGRYEEEGWRYRKDGSRFWANILLTPLRDETGTLLGFSKVTRDLTERRQAEEELRASEERFRTLVTSVKDYGIFLLDQNGNVASWNEGAERIEGYTSAEIIGRHFSTFYPEEDLRKNKPAWELEMATKDGRFEDEGWRVRKDGTRFWANVIITALFGPGGKPLGFAKVTRDLTERKASELRALEDARRLAEAEGANRAKSMFLASMSHELRTPLNAIGGYSDLILAGIAGEVSEQQREYLQRIRASQQHLLGVINDLLNYSRIEAGQMTYEISPVPVHGMVDNVLPLLEPQAAAKSIALSHGPCNTELIARADRTKAEQIVLNLLSNAVKFTPSGGQVKVECGAADRDVQVTVRDTGPGIPPDKQSAIFEPFVQLGRSLTTVHEGTGLGLAISRDLARAMGGDLTVDSTEGQGSAFTLTLPREKAA